MSKIPVFSFAQLGGKALSECDPDLPSELKAGRSVSVHVPGGQRGTGLVRWRELRLV